MCDPASLGPAARVSGDTDEEQRFRFVAVSVEERELPHQHFVGRALATWADETDELADDQPSAGISELRARLIAAGIALSGQFWTALRFREDGSTELVGCWEVPEALEGVWDSEADVVGTLPARRELVATWRPTEAPPASRGAADPGVAALRDALGRRDAGSGVGEREMRQRVLVQGGADLTVELAVTVDPPDPASPSRSERPAR